MTDGLPFDPWIRVHERVGGEIVGPASAAMRVTGTVAEWEQWTFRCGGSARCGGYIAVS